MSYLRLFPLLAGLLLINVVPRVQAGTMDAINHTKWAINSFSVDGQPGYDIIGPFQGGGGCCYSPPAIWKPGMTVRIDWERGVAFASDIPEMPEPVFPEYKNGDKKIWAKKVSEYEVQRREWYKKVKLLSRQLTKSVPVPDYSGEKTCGITVHFLPCDEVKVTTSCYTYGSPSYPIKEPVRMEEPKRCPT
ncbi:DUF3304 domain-containing protein [Tatumella saanichensis]|uniref:DUF3304 domain-containing protein n=1 Tax=Tatumella saanichensis TaxID=480813 RepID=UPI0004A2651C|nr:DUF3304 domain-containing protein [Tatumella saanichensis]